MNGPFIRHGTALFPISVGNKMYSSNLLCRALEQLALPVSGYTFFVVDRLQSYNRAIDGDFPAILHIQNSNQHFVERKRWLLKLKTKLSHMRNLTYLDVINVDAVTGCEFAVALRNLRILYETDANFHHDLQTEARTHLVERRSRSIGYDAAEALSVCYLLEEVALNICLRVLHDIEYECYLGPFSSTLLSLYARRYQATVFELAEVEEKSLTFQFLKYASTTIPEWTDVTIVDHGYGAASEHRNMVTHSVVQSRRFS